MDRIVHQYPAELTCSTLKLVESFITRGRQVRKIHESFRHPFLCIESEFTDREIKQSARIDKLIIIIKKTHQ